MTLRTCTLALSLLTAACRGDAGPQAPAAESPATDASATLQPSEPPRPKAAPIWQGHSAGFEVRWTVEDLSAHRQGREVFSVSRSLHTQFDAEREARQTDTHKTSDSQPDPFAPQPGACTRESKVRLLSLVESWLSYREARYTHCQAEAHPTKKPSTAPTT